MPQIASHRRPGRGVSSSPARLFLLACLVGLSGGWSLPKPSQILSPRYEYDCPEPPDGYLAIDSYSGARAYDWFKVENSLNWRIEVYVMVHDAQKGRWRTFASASVPPHKRVELEPFPKVRLKENRYYAVRIPGVDSKCLSHDVRHNDLYLYVGDGCETCRQASAAASGGGGAASEAPSAAPGAPAPSASYEIIQCEREAGSDFAYRFELKIVGDKSLRAFRSVQREFRAAIKEDYVESFSGARKDSLYVDFPEYRQNDDRISGRAVVLTLTVIKLDYNPDTRKGVMSVRIGANQFEEARKWIRKNIETLARDKNVALYTGELPSAAKFYLGRETIKDGNILEIEFETE